MLRILLLVMLVGCVHNQSDLAKYVDRTLLATSTTVIACDWGYTHRAAEGGWKGVREANPMLGPTPTVGAVNTYFIGVIALNAAVWALTPEKFRAILPMGITARGVYSLTGNSDSVGGTCGY